MAACGGGSDPSEDPTGSLVVTAQTAGSSLDPDGYTVAVDGGAGYAVPINGSVTIAGLGVGAHSLVITGVVGNCSLFDGSPRAFTIAGDEESHLTIEVGCSDPAGGPGTIDLQVTTLGASPDLDGYLYSVDSVGATARIGPNATVAITNVPPGPQTVYLTDVAPNCAVDGGAVRPLEVTTGLRTQLLLTINCVAISGTGSSLRAPEVPEAR